MAFLKVKVILSILLIYITHTNIFIYTQSLNTNDYIEDKTVPFDFWYQQTKQTEDEITKIRKHLHQIPETLLVELKTSNYIQQILKEFGINSIGGWAKHPLLDTPGAGVTADIGTGEPPCIMLRSDIDALPMEELADVNYKSTNKSLFHGCGHDGHISYLLGAAKILKQNEHLLNGTIRFVFQPGEEGGAGSDWMVKEGLLNIYPPVQRAFHMGLYPGSLSGYIHSSFGPVYSIANDFLISLRGTGGAGYAPNLNSHPLQAAVAIIHNIHDIQTYFGSHSEPGLISATILASESLPHVSPHHVTLAGTLRSFKMETMELFQQKLEKLVNYYSLMYNCEISYRSPSRDHMQLYPTVYNDLKMHEFFSKLFKPIALDNVIHDLKLDVGGEDFAFFAREVPSLIVNIGTGGYENQPYPYTNESCHSPFFVFDDTTLPKGSAIYSHFGYQLLHSMSKYNIK